MARFRLDIEGKPIPKGRPRTVRVNGRPVTYTPTRTLDWQDGIKLSYRQKVGRMMFDAGDNLALRCVFRQPRKTADGDNLYKAVADALEGVAYPNDRQIIEGSFFIVREGPPGVSIVCERVG